MEERSTSSLLLGRTDIRNFYASILYLLREIKAIEYLKQMPIILVTKSDNLKDVKAATEYEANPYMTKPDGYIELKDCLRSLFNFWFNHHTTIK